MPKPSICHCGQIALYVVGSKLFCKAHRSEAVSLMAKQNRSKVEVQA